MRRTFKNKKNLRKRRSRGGGWSDGPSMAAPGYLIHNPFTGPGKDCTGNPMSHRPGWLGSLMPTGLPGMRGGKRGKNKSRRHRGGTIPGVAMYDPSDVIIPKGGNFPNPSGSGGTVAQPDVQMSRPGVPVPQKGGRYGMFPGMGPLNPANGVGVSPAPFGRIACEAGIPNILNPNMQLQRMTTTPSMPPIMRGGATMSPAPYSGAAGASAANFPPVMVGAADSMRYYAPTAGYGHSFETMRAPSAVGGLMIEAPYSARAFNQACIKTGGSRHKSRLTKRRHSRSKGGAAPVAAYAANYTKATMSEIGNRSAFDGTKGGLPVKYGGSRRNRK